MKTYMRIDGGRAVELIRPMTYEFDAQDGSYRAGDEIPIEERYAAELVSTMVDITDLNPLPIVGMAYDGVAFSDYVAPAPSTAETLAANTAMRDALLAQAAIAIAPLQDAIDLDEATDAETTLLKQWKQYRVAINRVDLTVVVPAWPAQPG